MRPYFVKTPKIIQNIFSDYTWRIATDKKTSGMQERDIYLTFDDGPTPKITNQILQILYDFNAKATFFCVGDNIKKYPDIVQNILNKNHSIGNHTFNHLNGWITNSKQYISSVEKTERIIQSLPNQQAGLPLFRPPYGKIRSSQKKALLKKGYQIILWDVLSGDFDRGISKEQCYQNVIKNTQKGSIIVFHDSKKAFNKLQYVLPKALNYFTKKGFVFKSL